MMLQAACGFFDERVHVRSVLIKSDLLSAVFRVTQRAIIKTEGEYFQATILKFIENFFSIFSKIRMIFYQKSKIYCKL